MTTPQKCLDCFKYVIAKEHCCCQPYDCHGTQHKIKTNRDAGTCLDCGEGFCASLQTHCCCQKTCNTTHLFQDHYCLNKRNCKCYVVQQ